MLLSVFQDTEVLKRVRDLVESKIRIGKSQREISEDIQPLFPQFGLSRRTISRICGTLGPTLAETPTTENVVVPSAGEKSIIPANEDRKVLALQEELRNLRRRYRDVLREENTTEKLLSEMKGTIRAIPPAPPLSPLKTQGNGTPEQDLVALVSCLHFGEIVEPLETMGLAEYNPRLAAARVQKYVDSIIKLSPDSHDQTLYLVNIGDNISGDIHLELQITNAFPLGEQIVRCAYLWAMAIRDLAAHFKQVKFIGVVGNHARFEKKPPFKNKYNNGDYIIYHLIQGLLADQKNVNFTIPKSPWWVEKIKGQYFYFAHGDNINGGGFPWIGTQKYIAGMIQIFTRNGLPTPKIWCFGQFHQMNTFQLSYGEWLFTSSFKSGGDEYSLGKIQAGNSASQMFFGVTEEDGVTFRHPIILDHASPVEYNRYQDVSDPSWSPKPEGTGNG